MFDEDGFEKIMIEKLSKILPDYPEFLEEYRKKASRLDRYKRQRLSLSLATPTVEVLKWFAGHLKDEDGEPIPLSYIVEDLVTWVFSDPLVLYTFITMLYAEAEDDADPEEKNQD